MRRRARIPSGLALAAAAFCSFVYPSMSAAAGDQHTHKAQSIALLDDSAPPAQSGGDINAQMDVAIFRGNLAAVSALLDQGANINEALLEASSFGQASLVRVLLDRGANANKATAYGVTPLLDAAQAGKADAVSILVERGANIESRNWLGDTPLIEAAYSGDFATVKILLEHGAAVKAANRSGLTALAEAQERASDKSLPLNRNYHQIAAVLTSPDCARMNCGSVGNPPTGAPQIGPPIVPPSTTRCDPKEAAAAGGVSYKFPADMPPLVGDPVVVAAISTSVFAQVRVVAISGGKAIGVASEAVGDQPLAAYPGTDFQFQPELCVSGSWRTITNPLTSTLTYTIGKNGQAEKDLLNMVAAGETRQPTVGNIALSLDITFPAPPVVVSVEAKHNCHNFILAQEATNYGSVSINVGPRPYPAKIASVRLIYDGNYDPGDNPWHDSGLPPSPANPERLNSFPYSGALTSTVYDSSYTVVSDQNRSVGIPATGVCSDFVVDDAVELADGRKYHGHVRSD